MIRFLAFQPGWAARSPTPPDSIDEEKHQSKHISIVPAIVITPPPSPVLGVGHHAHSAGTNWERDLVYLHPPPYLHPLYHNYLRESRHGSLERRRLWWRTLSTVMLLLIITISLYGMYGTHSSEGRDREDLAAGRARQEPTWIPNAHASDASAVSFRFEPPRLLKWLAVDRDALSRAAPMGTPDDGTPRTPGLSILGVIGAGWRTRQDGETW